MKKAVLLPNIVGFPAVSMERYARELLRGLCELAAPNWQFNEIICTNDAFTEKLLPGTQGQKMGSRVGRFVKYPRLAAQAKGDVFHVLDHSHANLTLSLPPEKTIITCHDIIPYLAAKKLVPVRAGRLTAITFPQRIRCMKRCRFISADSESTKRDLMEHGNVPEKQIRVVYMGTNPVFNAVPKNGDAKTEQAALRKKWGIPPDARVLFHVGTSTRYKNTPALFRSLKILREEKSLGDTVWLVRAGAPFYDDESALMDELGVSARVLHIGRVSDEDLAAGYRTADIFVFPSLYEGFGWPPLEAMTCGAPVITSNAGSLPEIVGEAGITVAPTDYEALADAVRRVLGDAALATEMRNKSLARAARFTWEQCARETLAMYESVAA